MKLDNNLKSARNTIDVLREYNLAISKNFRQAFYAKCDIFLMDDMWIITLAVIAFRGGL